MTQGSTQRLLPWACIDMGSFRHRVVEMVMFLWSFGQPGWALESSVAP